jgi:hypothetical protein
MGTQKAKYKKLGAIIETPEEFNYTQLFKNTKFHHEFKSSPLGVAFLGLGRFIYKWIYFYLLPMMVVPVGIIGWQKSNLNEEWRGEYSVYVSWLPKRPEEYLFVDFDLNSNVSAKDVLSDNFMILFVLILFTIFTLIMYSVIRIGDIGETLMQAQQKKGKLLLYIFFGPFMYWILLYLLKFSWNTIDVLRNTGRYFKWIDINSI